tara:strand:+ start:1598 stop:2029 length:432 start_codon:yes stop_codon:yes gene_type:complete
MEMPASEEQIDLNKLIEVYGKIRDRRVINSKEFKDEDSRLERQQDVIKNTLLRHCVTANVSGAKADSGSFARTVKTRYWTSDWEPMYKLIREKNMPELLEQRLAQKNIKAYLEDNPEETIKGLQTDTKYVITVRKGKNNGDKI